MLSRTNASGGALSLTQPSTNPPRLEVGNGIPLTASAPGTYTRAMDEQDVLCYVSLDGIQFRHDAGEGWRCMEGADRDPLLAGLAGTNRGKSMTSYALLLEEGLNPSRKQEAIRQFGSFRPAYEPGTRTLLRQWAVNTASPLDGPYHKEVPLASAMADVRLVQRSSGHLLARWRLRPLGGIYELLECHPPLSKGGPPEEVREGKGGFDPVAAVLFGRLDNVLAKAEPVAVDF